MHSKPNHDQALPCWHCGYDLRATPHGQPCPECGKVDTMPPSGLRAEDGFLIVRPGATMPKRCVVNNQTEDLLPVTATFYRSPAWLDLTGCLFPPLLLLRRPLREHEFELTYWLSSRARRKQGGIGLLGGGLVVGGLGSCAYGPWLLAEPIGALLFIAGILGMVHASKILESRAYDGNDYWIKGCGKAFLEQINQDNRNDAAARREDQARAKSDEAS